MAIQASSANCGAFVGFCNMGIGNVISRRAHNRVHGLFRGPHCCKNVFRLHFHFLQKRIYKIM